MLREDKQDFISYLVLANFKANLMDKGIVKERIRVEVFGYTYSKIETKQVNLIKKPIDELFGVELFWQMFKQTESIPIATRLANYLMILYTPPNLLTHDKLTLYHQELKSLKLKAMEILANSNILNCIKASQLLMQLMQHEEQGGQVSLLSFMQCFDGEKIQLFIEKDSKFNKERTRISVYEHNTFFELREVVGREYRMPINSFNLLTENMQKIELNNNNSIIFNYGIQPRDTIVVQDAEVPESQEAELYDEHGNLTEAFVRVIEEIFETYATNNQMRKPELARFTTAATDNMECLETDDRVLTFFNSHDKENKGYLSLDDFKGFYKGCWALGEFKVRVIRNNLTSLGYGKDLQLKKHRGKHAKSIGSMSTRLEFCLSPGYLELLKKWIIVSHPEETLPNRVEQAHTSPCESSVLKGLEKDHKLTKFFEYLSPNTEYIRQAIDDPVGFLRKESHKKIWMFKLNFL